MKSKVQSIMPKITKDQMQILRKLISGHSTIRYGILQSAVYQTVENHTNRMLALAPVIAERAKLKFDSNELFAFILAHDLPELGMERDITILEQAEQKGAKQKKDEIEKQRKAELGTEYGAWLSNLFNEYEESKTGVTRFVKWLDKYEASRHMLEIDLHSEIALKSFNINTLRMVEATLKIPALREITSKHMDKELRPIWERYKQLDAFLELRRRLQ